jgi:hypothetical protein
MVWSILITLLVPIFAGAMVYKYAVGRARMSVVWGIISYLATGVVAGLGASTIMLLTANSFDESSSGAWWAFNFGYLAMGTIITFIVQGYIAKHLHSPEDETLSIE